MRARPIPGYCRCGKRMLMEANEGTCLACGHGTPDSKPTVHDGLAEMARRNQGCRPRMELDRQAA